MRFWSDSDPTALTQRAIRSSNFNFLESIRRRIRHQMPTNTPRPAQPRPRVDDGDRPLAMPPKRSRPPASPVAVPRRANEAVIEIAVAGAVGVPPQARSAVGDGPPNESLADKRARKMRERRAAASARGEVGESTQRMRQNREDDEYAAEEQARNSLRRVEANHNDEHVRERDRLAKQRFRDHHGRRGGERRDSLAAQGDCEALARQLADFANRQFRKANG